MDTLFGGLKNGRGIRRDRNDEQVIHRRIVHLLLLES